MYILPFYLLFVNILFMKHVLLDIIYTPKPVQNQMLVYEKKKKDKLEEKKLFAFYVLFVQIIT